MTLQVRHLVKHFGGVQAVKGVSFEVHAGECVALIGPNGAGKSTTFACIAGQHRLTGGEVRWAGEHIDTLSPAQRLARGVARTFQVAQTLEALTVLQNVQLLTQAPYGLAAYNVLNSEQPETALALLAQVGLQHLANVDVLGLPYGAKKRLELALALAGVMNGSVDLEADAGLSRAGDSAQSPRLLLLDEPAAGLAGPERADLMALVKSLTHMPGLGSSTATDHALTGLAVLYTEHNMDAVFGVADRVLVLIDGQIAAQGTPDDMARNEVVRTRYLGVTAPGRHRLAQPASPERSWPAPQGDAGSVDRQTGLEENRLARSTAFKPATTPILSIEDLSVWYGAAQALFDVSLQVGQGELVVLQGLNGAGKSTLLQAIMGLSPRDTGRVSYENQCISAWAPHRRAQLGLGYVAEDRRLFTGLTVQENLRLAARGDVAGNEARVLDLFPALKTMRHRLSGQMSGGEQQMLAIARTLMTAPQLLLLDEPCEGIAPVLVENITEALLTLKAQGLSLLVAEQNKLLADRADRVITLVAGQISA